MMDDYMDSERLNQPDRILYDRIFEQVGQLYIYLNSERWWTEQWRVIFLAKRVDCTDCGYRGQDVAHAKGHSYHLLVNVIYRL